MPQNESHGVTADAFRDCFRRQVSTVAIITSQAGAIWGGATATAVSSISARPPTLLVAMNRSSTTASLIASRGLFCVNFVDESQEEVARIFAEPAASLTDAGAKFARSGRWVEGFQGLPLLEGAVASLCCAVEQMIESHTHTLFVGRIEECSTGEGRPLLYGFGRYLAAEDVSP